MSRALVRNTLLGSLSGARSLNSLHLQAPVRRSLHFPFPAKPRRA